MQWHCHHNFQHVRSGCKMTLAFPAMLSFTCWPVRMVIAAVDSCPYGTLSYTPQLGWFSTSSTIYIVDFTSPKTDQKELVRVGQASALIDVLGASCIVDGKCQTKFRHYFTDWSRHWFSLYSGGFGGVWIPLVKLQPWWFLLLALILQMDFARDWSSTKNLSLGWLLPIWVG